MDDRNTPFEAEWAGLMQHRPDPNRVNTLQVPSLRRDEPSLEALPGLTAGTAVAEVRSALPTPQAAGEAPGEPAYYDISMLQKPVWRWQIASYFFLGGVTAGSYLIARVVDRTTPDENRDVVRAGTWIALATLIPCPLLLINDLGDPKRFHHMLRVFKPGSPMNLGTWVLTAYGGMLAASVLREWLRDRGINADDREPEPRTLTKLWSLLHDAAGIPLALAVAGYTGVLLSCTANPLWCKNRWLGPLFSASAISTGAEAITLALECRSDPRGRLESAKSKLRTIDTAAHLVEAVCMAGFTREAAQRSQPLKRNTAGIVHRVAVGTLIASEALKHLPVGNRFRKPLRVLSAAAGLVAGFSMRWSMVYAGKDAADDPRLARLVSRPSRPH